MTPVYASPAMEAKLVVFLTFVWIVLTANALVIWFAYRAFANIATSVTNNVREFQTSGATQSLLKSLETASAQAVQLTDFARTQLGEFGPKLASAQSVFGFGLAKADVKFERLCDNISLQMMRAQKAVTGPAEKIGAAASGLQTVLEFSEIFTVGQSDFD